MLFLKHDGPEAMVLAVDRHSFYLMVMLACLVTPACMRSMSLAAIPRDLQHGMDSCWMGTHLPPCLDPWITGKSYARGSRSTPPPSMSQSLHSEMAWFASKGVCLVHPEDSTWTTSLFCFDHISEGNGFGRHTVQILQPQGARFRPQQHSLEERSQIHGIGSLSFPQERCSGGKRGLVEVAIVNLVERCKGLNDTRFPRGRLHKDPRKKGGVVATVQL